MSLQFLADHCISNATAQTLPVFVAQPFLAVRPAQVR